MEAHRTIVTRRALAAIMPMALLCASPALAARTYPLDLPAGRLSGAVAALGRQAGASVSVDDAALWQRPVPAVKGMMSVPAALKRLLGDDARVVAAGADAWRIRRVAAAPARPPARAPSPPPPAIAGEAPIIVTASKRDLRLRDYAGAVSTIDGSELNFGGAGGTDAILARLATVSSTHLGAGRNKLFVRGIADSSFTGPTQATVGQYLGDVRLTYNAPDPDLRLYDMRSVEVLEGPQGTLYGAGSLGGIIRTVPNDPALDRTGGSVMAGASLTQHGAASGDIAAMLNLPLVADRIGLRVVGYGLSDGGYIDNPLRHRTNINRTTIAGGRAALRLDAGDDWIIDLGGIVQHTHGDDSQYADRDAPPLTRDSPVPEGFTASYRLGEVAVSKQWDRLRFRWTTAIIGQDLKEQFNATQPFGAPSLFRQRNRTDLLTSEARLWQPLDDRFGWVLGASYTRNDTRLSRTLGSVGAPAPVTGVANRVREFTLYGEASLRLTPWLTATAGGRASITRLSGGAKDVVPAPSAFEALARAAVIADRKTTSYLPSVALLANILPRTTLYARYQQGFRPGGLAIDSSFVRRFRGDRVETAEAGLRYGAPGRDAADLSLVVSHSRWQHIQADFLDASGLPTTDNIGDGRIWSVAASAGWRPAPGLRFDASLAFNDGRVTEPSASYRAVLAASTAIGEGVDRIPNIARFTGRVGVDWLHPLDDRLTLHLNAWGRYVGRSRLGVGPVLGAEQGDYPDSAVTVRVGTPTMGVTLGMTNLSDSAGNRFALGTPFANGLAQITPLRPRTLRIGFDASF